VKKVAVEEIKEVEKKEPLSTKQAQKVIRKTEK